MFLLGQTTYTNSEKYSRQKNCKEIHHFPFWQRHVLSLRNFLLFSERDSGRTLKLKSYTHQTGPIKFMCIWTSSTFVPNKKRPNNWLKKRTTTTLSSHPICFLYTQMFPLKFVEMHKAWISHYSVHRWNSETHTKPVKSRLLPFWRQNQQHMCKFEFL